MVLVPAINIQNKQYFSLFKGNFDKNTVHGDPIEIAKKWKDIGAKRIHLMNIDRACKCDTTHLKIIEAIINEVDIPLELDGGIRDMETIKRYIEMGVDRVILRTAAVDNIALVACAAAIYGKGIVVRIDALNGIVNKKALIEDTKKEAIQLGLEMKELGIERIIYTKINKDGNLAALNLEETKRFTEAIGLKVTIFCSMSVLKDIKDVYKLEAFGVDEVIF